MLSGVTTIPGDELGILFYYTRQNHACALRYLNMKVGIIGGGAAGLMAAVAVAESDPSIEVFLIERNPELGKKVLISGGGRCNVTHACFDVRLLIQNYPRGAQELIGPFTRFQPRDTIEWFESRGVKLKTL